MSPTYRVPATLASWARAPGSASPVKRYESEKVEAEGGTWRHVRITLRPNNPEFDPIELTSDDEGQLQVVAELVEVRRVGLEVRGALGAIELARGWWPSPGKMMGSGEADGGFRTRSHKR